MAIFSVSMIKAHRANSGETPSIRVMFEEDKLPPECLLPGDMDGSPKLGKLPAKEQKVTVLIEGVVWDKHAYHLLPQKIADRLLIMALHVGPAQAHRLLQRAVRSLDIQVAETGQMDNATRRSVMIACSRLTEQALIGTMRAQHEGFCRQVAVAAPKTLLEHLPGWIDSANG